LQNDRSALIEADKMGTILAEVDADRAKASAYLGPAKQWLAASDRDIPLHRAPFDPDKLTERSGIFFPDSSLSSACLERTKYHNQRSDFAAHPS
jgi:hypothetical protein